MEQNAKDALESGDLPRLKDLVASGQVPVHGVEGTDSPLHLATLHGHLDIARYLVEEAGADPWHRNGEGMSPLDLAAYNGHLEVVRYLIEERGMDPSEVNAQVGLKGPELC